MPTNIEGKYPTDWIEMLLANYDALISDAAELAAEWAEMDKQEQIHHRSISMQIWGMRRTLGECYQANLVDPMQVAKLATLDRALLSQASVIEVCYGPSLEQLMNNLLKWGTPLSQESGSIQLEVPLRILPTLAQVLAREAVGSR